MELRPLIARPAAVYAALMEGALQLAVSDRLPCTPAGSNPRSGIRGYRDPAIEPLLSSEVVNE
jgi:hypothetical protein